jgi:hypothetical protein
MGIFKQMLHEESKATGTDQNICIKHITASSGRSSIHTVTQFLSELVSGKDVFVAAKGKKTFVLDRKAESTKKFLGVAKSILSKKDLDTDEFTVEVKKLIKAEYPSQNIGAGNGLTKISVSGAYDKGETEEVHLGKFSKDGMSFKTGLTTANKTLLKEQAGMWYLRKEQTEDELKTKVAASTVLTKESIDNEWQGNYYETVKKYAKLIDPVLLGAIRKGKYKGVLQSDKDDDFTTNVYKKANSLFKASADNWNPADVWYYTEAAEKSFNAAVANKEFTSIQHLNIWLQKMSIIEDGKAPEIIPISFKLIETKSNDGKYGVFNFDGVLKEPAIKELVYTDDKERTTQYKPEMFTTQTLKNIQIKSVNGVQIRVGTKSSDTMSPMLELSRKGAGVQEGAISKALIIDELGNTPNDVDFKIGKLPALLKEWEKETPKDGDVLLTGLSNAEKRLNNIAKVLGITISMDAAYTKIKKALEAERKADPEVPNSTRQIVLFNNIVAWLNYIYLPVDLTDKASVSAEKKKEHISDLGLALEKVFIIGSKQHGKAGPFYKLGPK